MYDQPLVGSLDYDVIMMSYMYAHLLFLNQALH